jgi:hypothetical protein
VLVCFVERIRRGVELAPQRQEMAEVGVRDAGRHAPRPVIDDLAQAFLGLAPATHLDQAPGHLGAQEGPPLPVKAEVVSPPDTVEGVA